MQDFSYWHKQTTGQPIYPDFEWSKPERRDQAGKLAIIGGNRLGFSGVADSYQAALEAGVGQVRVVLPDSLQKTVPPALLDVIFAPSNSSGGLASAALDELMAASSWADVSLLIGDAARSSETAVLHEQLITKSTDKLVISRDAIDLMRSASQIIVERPNTLLVMSFSQLQKLFQSVYYPKMLLFKMQLLQLVEALHKFTITYPVAIAVFHADNLVIAANGQVVSQEWAEPMQIWRGQTATKAACYWLWGDDALIATTASLAAS